MKKVERVMAYAGFGAACVVGSFLAVRTFETPAHASAAGFQEAGKIAVVDVLEVSEKLFMSDRYMPAREAMLKEKQEQIKTLQDALQELAQKVQAAGQNSPDAQALRQQYEAQAQSFGQVRDSANNELNTLSTQQFSEAYRLVIDTSDAVAKRQGFGFVLATRTGAPEFRSKELQGALQEVLARPVLVLPEGVNITGAVIGELKLESVKMPSPLAPETPLPTPAPANK
jgi:Skp family chaperone for outer membrane proteins